MVVTVAPPPLPPVRRLATADAVVLGLAAMLGTGVFAVFSPAAAAAGYWLPLAVAIAAVVATCNAAASADLAAARPAAAGGYAYSRELLHPAVGRLAGAALLAGTSSTAAAAAGVFGAYVLPSASIITSVAAIVAVTGLSLFGVRLTERTAWLLVGGTAAVLLVVVIVGLFGPGGTHAASTAAATSSGVPEGVALAPPQVTQEPGGGIACVIGAAGLIFFAFAGNERFAAAGAGAGLPARTLRKAVLIALGIATAVYFAVIAALLKGLGPVRLADEHAPLVALVDTGDAPALGVLVRVAAAVAAGSVLLAVLVAGSQTARAMAQHGDLPRPFAKARGGWAPWVADLGGALVAILIAVLAGPMASIALAACAALVHAAIVNVAALRLPRTDRHWPIVLPLAGLVGSVTLAVLLPLQAVVVTVVAVAAGWLASTLWSLFARRRAALQTAEDRPQGGPPEPGGPPGRDGPMRPRDGEEGPAGPAGPAAAGEQAA